MEQAERTFRCMKCNAIHLIVTNHLGQVYMQKCKNWPCTPGAGMFTTMEYWQGPIELRETTFYANAGDQNKAKLNFAVHQLSEE